MHRWSKLFIPTLREAPADAEVASHKLLLRGGYIRQLGAGIYSFLFLGNRSINKIVAIIREEMDTIGQEMLLPALHPREIWEESGRWTGMGDNMFRLRDRKGAELCLGMTHEEIITSIARNELRSYKQLPQIWYQIQTKFRDEPRPKSGLLRVRQFLMKDAYSIDLDEAGLDASYDAHDRVYRRIFDRCGLEYVAVEADSGAMGGSQSQEFMVYTEAGEDLIASSASGYAANLEKATSLLAPVADLEPTGDGLPELVSTPGKASIADVTAFFGIAASQDIKCVAFMGSTTQPSCAPTSTTASSSAKVGSTDQPSCAPPSTTASSSAKVGSLDQPSCAPTSTTASSSAKVGSTDQPSCAPPSTTASSSAKVGSLDQSPCAPPSTTASSSAKVGSLDQSPCAPPSATVSSSAKVGSLDQSPCAPPSATASSSAKVGSTDQPSCAPPSTTASSSAKVGSTDLRPIVAFLRGDHQVNETKLMALTGVVELRPMLPEELALHIGGPAGFLGPVGIAEVMTQGSLNGLNSGKAIEKLKGVLREDASALKTIVVMDLGLAGRKNLVAGANQLDFHFRNVTPGRDFTPTLTADIRNILEGELDPVGGLPLRLGKAVEIGHIFKLGRKYSSSMHSTVLNRDGKEVVPTMGSYGIGVERILTAAIETSAASFSLLSSRSAAEGSASPPATAEQFALPPSIAPFEVVVTITNVKEPALVAAGEKLAAELSAAGLDVLLDDRDERAGVKFKDADLIGVPFRIAVGRSLAEGKVEFLNRLTNQTAEIRVSEVPAALLSLLR
jgi:prolyl-tRNA synthetase